MPWKSTCPVPDLLFCMFATLKSHFYFSDQTDFNIDKYNQIKTQKAVFNWWFYLLRGKKTLNLHGPMWKRNCPPSINHEVTMVKSHFLESWVKLQWPHPSLITAGPVKSRDHLNLTCLTKTKSPQKARHATIQRKSGTDEKQSNWHLSAWKRL